MSSTEGAGEGKKKAKGIKDAWGAEQNDEVIRLKEAGLLSKAMITAPSSGKKAIPAKKKLEELGQNPIFNPCYNRYMQNRNSGLRQFRHQLISVLDEADNEEDGDDVFHDARSKTMKDEYDDATKAAKTADVEVKIAAKYQERMEDLCKIQASREKKFTEHLKTNQKQRQQCLDGMDKESDQIECFLGDSKSIMELAAQAAADTKAAEERQLQAHRKKDEAEL